MHPKIVGRKSTKEKREEATNKEKLGGLQSTLDKSMGVGSRNMMLKNPKF